MNPRALLYPYSIADRREFILAYYKEQRAECKDENCPICDAEAQDAISIWDALHRRNE